MNKMTGLALEIGAAHLASGAWKIGGVYEVRVNYVTRPKHAIVIGITRRRDLRGPNAPECSA